MLEEYLSDSSFSLGIENDDLLVKRDGNFS